MHYRKIVKKAEPTKAEKDYLFAAFGVKFSKNSGPPTKEIIKVWAPDISEGNVIYLLQKNNSLAQNALVAMMQAAAEKQQARILQSIAKNYIDCISALRVKEIILLTFINIWGILRCGIRYAVN